MTEEASRKFQLYITNKKSRADLFKSPINEQLKTEGTNPNLVTSDAIDGMTIFNCGFKFQNSTHAGIVKQCEVWLNNVVQQQGQANFPID